MNRRSFLVGLFGTAAVAAAGPLPKIIENLPEKDFINAVNAILPSNDEVYSNGRDYAFATIKYLTKAPWLEVTIPDGFRPLRGESNKIAAEAIARMKANV